MGYHAAKHRSVSRHVVFVFLVVNGCLPSVALAWLHTAGFVASDALDELIADLKLLRDGLYRNSTTMINKITYNESIVRATLPDASFDDVDVAIQYAKAHKTTRIDDCDPLADCREARALYFYKMFPFEDLVRLLHRDESSWQRREITVGKDTPLNRSRPILSLSYLKWSARTRLTSMHAGAAFDAAQEPRTNVQPLGTEICLEVDEPPKELAHIAVGLDDVAKNDGRLWWRWLEHAVAVTARVLALHCGVEKVFCFSSGGKSPHVWLLDDFVLRQTPTERKAFVAKLADPTRQPWWAELYETILLPFYNDVLLRPCDDGGFGLRLAARNRSTAEIAALTFPAFDLAVATEAKHTHRMPFSVHDSTARVALPFTATTIPTCTADMPRVDDPQLVSKIKAPLAMLKRAISALGPVSSTSIDEVDELATATWSVERREKKRRRDEEAGAGAPAPSNKALFRGRCRGVEEHATLRVAPLPIDREATGELKDTLDAAVADASLTLEALPADHFFKTLVKNAQPGKWRERLAHESKKLGRLLATGVDKLAGIVKADDSGGRMSVHYPELGMDDFLKGIAAITRHKITGHRLLELDISGAHPAAAWAALLAKHGDGAAVLCPCLSLFVADRKKAVARVKREYATPKSDAEAKVLILRSLNQSSGDEAHRHRKPFLKALVEERRLMEEALLEFAPLASCVVAIREKARGGKPTTLLSLLMQAVENAVITESAQSLELHGWRLVAPISDAVHLSR